MTEVQLTQFSTTRQQ